MFRPTAIAMRRLLIVAGALVFLAGFQLFILTEQTDLYFAWTIHPPLTAAFLGAGYFASFLLEVLAAKEREWARTRIAVPALFTFTTLTLIATILHANRFHFSSPFPFAQAAAWFWLAIYAIVPPTMLVVWVRQLRIRGDDRARSAAISKPFLIVLFFQAVIMLLVGSCLFVFPAIFDPGWPWKLTPLTSRAIGAWLMGLGVFAAHAVAENDYSRIRPGVVGYIGFSLLELIALVRYPTSISWDQPASWLYRGFLVSILLIGMLMLPKLTKASHAD